MKGVKTINTVTEWHGADVLRNTIYAHYTEDTALETRCAKRCLLSAEGTCQYYLIHDNYCQLGSFTSNGIKAVGTFTNSITYYRKTVISNEWNQT